MIMRTKTHCLLALTPWLLASCVIGPGLLEAGGENEDEPSTETSGDGSITTTGESSASETDSEGEGESETDPAEPDPLQPCDMIAQDCDEGFKCVAVPTGRGQGGFETACVPAADGIGVAGEPCVMDPTDWSDTCDADHVCWNSEPSLGSGQLEGTCHPLCNEQASCEGAGQLCGVFNDAMIAVCLFECTPGQDACPEDHSCNYIFGAEEGYACLLGGEDPQGMDCTNIADCPAGYHCLDSEFLLECESEACCTSYCDPEDPEACEGLDPLTCGTFFNEPPAEDFGVCMLL